MAGEDSKRARTPKTAKLPGRSLEDALLIAKALSDLNVPSSKDMIASQAGGTSKGGSFKTQFAAAGYYGLHAKEGDKFKLTDRGERALAGDGQAKRDAVMATGFGPIIESFSTRPVNDKAIESRLKIDHSASDSGAEKGRIILVGSAEDAGLIVNGKFDAEAIESVESVGPPAKESKAAKKPSGPAVTPSRQTPVTPAPPKAQDPPPPPPPPKDPEPPAQVTTPIQLVVQLDGSKMEPAKIAELIHLLREPK